MKIIRLKGRTMKNNQMKLAITYAPSEQQFLPVPPLGIAVISQYLQNKGIHNDTIDLELELWLSLGCKSSEFASKSIDELEIDNLPIDGIIEKLIDYEIITFSIMGKRQIPYMISIIKNIKLKPNKLKYVVVGGSFFSSENVRDFLYNYKEYVDYAIVGEGCQPLYQIMSQINLGMSYIDFPGIAYQDVNGDIIYRENKNWGSDITVTNYQNVNTKGYIKQQKVLYALDDEKIVYHVLVGDRYCPYNCSFCRISKNTKNVKNPADIAKEMIQLNQTSGAERFSLVCNEMNPTEEYFNIFLDKLLEYNKRLSWFCYLRPNNLSKNTLEKARKAGCVLVRYGVETGSQRILDLMNKALSIKEIEQIMKDTSNVGIWNHINIITGYLHETYDDVDKTLTFLENNKNYINSVRVNPFYIPLNSPIHKHPERHNIILHENTGSHIQFDEPNCTWENKQKYINNVTEMVLNKCIELNLNFAGILPFLVMVAADHFGNAKDAQRWIESKHSYLCQPLSPDTAKFYLAHPDRNHVLINTWKDISGKRGSNYQTYIG